MTFQQPIEAPEVSRSDPQDDVKSPTPEKFTVTTEEKRDRFDGLNLRMTRTKSEPFHVQSAIAMKENQEENGDFQLKKHEGQQFPLKQEVTSPGIRKQFSFTSSQIAQQAFKLKQIQNDKIMNITSNHDTVTFVDNRKNCSSNPSSCTDNQLQIKLREASETIHARDEANNHPNMEEVKVSSADQFIENEVHQKTGFNRVSSANSLAAAMHAGGHLQTQHIHHYHYIHQYQNLGSEQGEQEQKQDKGEKFSFNFMQIQPHLVTATNEQQPWTEQMTPGMQGFLQNLQPTQLNVNINFTPQAASISPLMRNWPTFEQKGNTTAEKHPRSESSQSLHKQEAPIQKKNQSAEFDQVKLNPPTMKQEQDEVLTDNENNTPITSQQVLQYSIISQTFQKLAKQAAQQAQKLSDSSNNPSPVSDVKSDSTLNKVRRVQPQRRKMIVKKETVTEPVKSPRRRRRQTNQIGKPVTVDGVVIDDYVASQDLNECVDALIKKGSKHMQPDGILVKGGLFIKNSKLQLGKRKSSQKKNGPCPKVIYYHKMCENPELESRKLHQLGKNSRRLRKNQDQYKILLNEFDKEQIWSKERIHELAETSGLSWAQIYKWNWDQRKKIMKGQ